MKQRTITAVVLAITLLPLVIINHYITEMLFLVAAPLLCSFGSYEIVNMVYQKEKANGNGILNSYRYIVAFFSFIIAFLCQLSTITFSHVDLNYPWASAFGFVNITIVIIVFLIAISSIMGAMIFTKHSETSDIMACLLGLTYSGLMFGLVLSLRYMIPETINLGIVDLNGIKCFIYVYTIVVSNDMFAYFFGIKFGKHRLCVEISPKKSVEGAIAGFVFGIVFSVAGLFMYGIVKTTNTTEVFVTICLGILIGAFLSVMVQLGDLIASKFKRSYGIKDFSNIFPGHGGVLDRFDSLIYSGIWFYLIIICLTIVLGF